MIFLEVSEPALNAVVPTAGFHLSTWSLPFIKDLWIKYEDNKIKQNRDILKCDTNEFTDCNETCNDNIDNNIIIINNNNNNKSYSNLELNDDSNV
jgi:hypothetical protein